MWMVEVKVALPKCEALSQSILAEIKKVIVIVKEDCQVQVAESNGQSRLAETFESSMLTLSLANHSRRIRAIYPRAA